MELKTIENFFANYQQEFHLSDLEKTQILDSIDFEYAFDKQDNYFRIYFLGRSKDQSKVLLKHVVMVNDHRVYVDYDAKNSILFQDIEHKDEMNLFMVKQILDSTSFLEELKNVYNDVFLSWKKQIEKEFEKKLDYLISRVNSQDVVDTSSQIHLTPFLIYREDSVFLSLKIGRDKEYTVKKIGDFLYRFRNEVTYRYGKDLEIVHSISLFDDSSRNLFKIVESLFNKNSLNNTNELKLDSKSILKVFENYQDSYINLNNNVYYVRLEKKEVKINVDSRYLLSVILPEDYLKINHSSIIIDQKNKCIDVLDGSRIYLALVDYVINSEYPSIANRTEDFKYNFILRNPSGFILDPSIKDEFSFGQLNIKSYFDYVDDSINLEKHLFVDEKEVSVEKLNKYNLLQYQRYEQILATYGFNDGVINDERLIWEFFDRDLSELRAISTIYLSDSITNKTLNSFVPPKIRLNLDGNLLDVFIDDSRYSEEELLKIYSALKKKKHYVVLNNNVINLDSDDSRLFLEQSESYNLCKNKSIRPQKLPIYYAFRDFNRSNTLSFDEKISDIFMAIKNFKKMDIDSTLPNNELRQYQIDGVKWLYTLYKYHLSGILADDMGLGKTIEIISFINNIRINKPILIVCPKSLLFNWKSEFNKFNPSQKVILIYGDKNTRVNLIKNINCEEKTVYIVGYESLRLDEKEYKDKEFELLILDEGQMIKNVNAQKTISVSHINSGTRFVLTGTPIENSVLDLWSLFNFLMPFFFPAIDEFKHRMDNEPDYMASIRKKIAPFILRRTKKDVLKDLPNKYEVILNCEMEEEQNKIYDAFRLQAKKQMYEKNKIFDVLPILMRLRQICISPSLFLDDYNGSSGKLEMLINIAKEKIYLGHKILIFSQFVKALEIVSELLESNNISYSMITGDTKGEDRLLIANEFNSNKNLKVLLISLKAGGNGLNLVGADTVIHLDPWWNVASQDQATDRAYRIGQDKNVEVIKLICEHSIEERVLDLQEKKKEIIRDLISENDSSITKLTLEDIEYILG